MRQRRGARHREAEVSKWESVRVATQEKTTWRNVGCTLPPNDLVRAARFGLVDREEARRLPLDDCACPEPVCASAIGAIGAFSFCATSRSDRERSSSRRAATKPRAAQPRHFERVGRPGGDWRGSRRRALHDALARRGQQQQQQQQVRTAGSVRDQVAAVRAGFAAAAAARAASPSPSGDCGDDARGVEDRSTRDAHARVHAGHV